MIILLDRMLRSAQSQVPKGFNRAKINLEELPEHEVVQRIQVNWYFKKILIVQDFRFWFTNLVVNVGQELENCATCFCLSDFSEAHPCPFFYVLSVYGCLVTIVVELGKTKNVACKPLYF